MVWAARTHTPACPQIVSSSYAAAAYLLSVGFDSAAKKVLLLGPVGVEDELAEAVSHWAVAVGGRPTEAGGWGYDGCAHSACLHF